jgi:tRNA(fMet)-specific endonuclease VapC
MRYMLDTNICIYVARGDDTALLEKLESFFVGDLVMSAITLAELEAGVRRDAGWHRRREEALGELVRFIEPVAFDERAAACFGDLQAAMEDRKRGGYDRLIAAHAVSLWLPLVTNNVRDFCDMPGLRLENWAAG